MTRQLKPTVVSLWVVVLGLAGCGSGSPGTVDLSAPPLVLVLPSASTIADPATFHADAWLNEVALPYPDRHWRLAGPPGRDQPVTHAARHIEPATDR